MSKQIIGELKYTKKYIPELNKKYCYIDLYGNIVITSNTYTSFDKWIIKHHPVFILPDDCEIYKQYLELLDEYTFSPNWKDLRKDKYFPIYNAAIDEIYPDVARKFMSSFYYFESADIFKEFIRKAGKQNVKRFMFDIWE